MAAPKVKFPSMTVFERSNYFQKFQETFIFILLSNFLKAWIKFGCYFFCSFCCKNYVLNSKCQFSLFLSSPLTSRLSKNVMQKISPQFELYLIQWENRSHQLRLIAALDQFSCFCWLFSLNLLCLISTCTSFYNQNIRLNLKSTVQCWLDKTNNRNRTVQAITRKVSN